MKKIVTIFMTLLLLLSIGTAVYAFDISPAIGILRDNKSFTKCSLNETTTSFTKEDFVNVVGCNFDYITITKTPDKEYGSLSISGVDVIDGQCIIAESLDLLKFIPVAGKQSNSPSFTFTVSADGWKGTDITCNINYLSSVNYAPVINNSSMKTVKNISVYSTIKAYDPDNDDIIYKIGAYPSFGAVEINQSLGRITYTPEKDFTGNDVLTVYALDEYGNRSGEATIYVAVDSESGNMTFGDMTKSQLHYAAIALSQSNIMTYSKKGGEYYFSPDEEVNKIDFTVMLLCASGLNEGISQIKDTEFIDDTNLSVGRKSYLKRALDVEIIDVGDRYFNPTNTITAREATEMVARSLGLDKSSDTVKNIMGNSVLNETLTKESVAEILYNVCIYLG